MVNRSGQVLVLVLLVVVVSLAIGLSVASRNITNLKTATQSERSQRAFSASEGGVEDVLSKLNQVATDITTGSATSGCPVSGDSATCTVPVGNISATVNVKSYNTFDSTIELGSVGQIDINPDGTLATQVRIDWGKATGALYEPSIEVIEYYKKTDGTYDQNRKYFQGDNSSPAGRAANETGPFDAPGVCIVIPGYKCAIFGLQTLGVQAGPSGFRILRIRPFWDKASVKVSGVGGTIPLQSFKLESTARTDEGLTRKVEVNRNALPALPAAFDYALFSSGSITK